MILLLLGSLAVLAYIYGGYLLILRLVVAVRGPRVVRKADIHPSLSLVISAYNEAAVIRKKLDNTVQLLYPRDRLEIAVISDASDDGTDDIVREFADRGVTLFRQPVRKGKTGGLNAVVPQLRGDVVVFSDANAMYASDALLQLARNFADPVVGCVTGEARYLPGSGATADAGERAYWNYEMYVKRMETALGSMVGGDGAIYAIRRALWQRLPDNAINDFLNPLQIVAAGWRSVYEPQAVCYEETAGRTSLEYRRRVRIVSRSWRAIFQAPNVLNPFSVGAFTWSLLSHKVLRWLSGVFALIAAVTSTALVSGAIREWPRPLVALFIAGAAALAGTRRGRRLLGLIGYFSVVSAASVVGVLKGSFGHVSGVWTTPRGESAGGAQRDTAARLPGLMMPAGRIFLAVIATIVLALTAMIAAGNLPRATTVFWGAVAALFYVYVGYPLVLATLKSRPKVAADPAAAEPTICLFIAANDEGDVIEAKLRNALSLDYPSDRLDIVVASDGSVDETNAIARRFAPRVRLLEFTPRRGKAAVINDGLRDVTSDIVVFSDANTFLESGALRALACRFADPEVGAVSGDVMLEGERAALAYSEDLYYYYERGVQSAESAVGSMIGVDGALYALRRDLFVAPPADTILDDMAIPMAVVRAGRRVVFEPTARAHEQGSNSSREEFARKSRVIAGAVQFLARRDSAVPLGAPQVAFSLWSHKALRWLSPVFVACTVGSSLMLAATSVWYGLAAAVHLLLMAGGVAGCLPALRRVSLISLAHYFCLVQAAAAVGFVRGLIGRQSVRWHRVRRTVAGRAPDAVHP